MADILSQAEIDALLSALDQGGVGDEPRGPGLNPRGRSRAVKNYDFRRPDKFSKDQIRALHMVMENFSRSWGTFLSGKLRSLVYLELNTIDQMTYEEFLQSLSSPTVIAVFSLETLEGSALLEINPTLAFTMIDRLLGGLGKPSGINRELTEIEEAIMGGIISDTWRYLRAALKDIVAVNPRLDGLEYNPQFVQIVPPGDMVLFVSINMRIGDIRDIVVFCFPFLLLEPILSKLNTQQFFAVRRESDSSAREITQNLHDMGVETSVELGRAQLTVRDVLALSEGDVIRLETRLRDPVTVYVEGRAKFKALPGLVGESRAVEVTDYIEPGGARPKARPLAAE